MSPFKSQAQRRFLYKNEPEVAKKWEKETTGRTLPTRVKGKNNPMDMLKRGMSGAKK